MMLSLLLVCVLQFAAFAHGFYYDVCPRDDISPCTCDNEGINCNLMTELKDVENAFKTRFKYNAIRALYLQGTSLKELSPQVFQRVKIQEVYLEDNQFTSFNLDILDHSTDFTSTINLYNNKLTKFPFEKLESYWKLRSINLGKNRLSSIPDNAFSKNTELTEIALQGNAITDLGRDAFDDLPNLKKISLASNAIQILASGSMNFHPEVKSIEIHLENNNISSISKSAFGKGEPKLLALGQNKLKYLDEDIFGNLARKMANHGGIIDVQRNPLTCRGCEYKWMIPEKYALHETIVNVICPDGTTLVQLTIHKIQCNDK